MCQCQYQYWKWNSFIIPSITNTHVYMLLLSTHLRWNASKIAHFENYYSLKNNLLKGYRLIIMVSVLYCCYWKIKNVVSCHLQSLLICIFNYRVNYVMHYVYIQFASFIVRFESALPLLSTCFEISNKNMAKMQRMVIKAVHTTITSSNSNY